MFTSTLKTYKHTMYNHYRTVQTSVQYTDQTERRKWEKYYSGSGSWIML